MTHTCGPIVPLVLLMLLKVGGVDFELHPLGVSGSGLTSPWFMVQYSWDIEEVGLCMGVQPADTRLKEVHTSLALADRHFPR